MTIDMKNSIIVATQVKQDLTALNLNDPDVKAYFVSKYAPGATDLELAEYISTAIADEAVPGRDIYFLKYKSKDGGYYPASFVHSINWMTRKAEESGNFIGFTEPEYLDTDGTWHRSFWPYDCKQKAPLACRIGLIKKSSPDHPGMSTVRWDERAKMYNGKLQGEWANQPVHMLTKCAKAQAYRDAGFQGLTGRYIREELLPPDGEWQKPANYQELVEKQESERRIKNGELRDKSELPLDAKDKAGLKLAFKELNLTNESAGLSWVNEVLKANDLDTVDKITALNKGQFAIIIQAAKEQIEAGLDLTEDPEWKSEASEG